MMLLMMMMVVLGTGAGAGGGGGGDDVGNIIISVKKTFNQSVYLWWTKMAWDIYFSTDPSRKKNTSRNGPFFHCRGLFNGHLGT